MTMNTFAVLLVLAGAALSSVSGHVVPQNCSTHYQSAVKEALDNEDCRDVQADDCCQIMNLARLVDTAVPILPLKSGIRYIGQACSHQNEFLTHGEMKARCDMETDEGGWLVIQRRVSGGKENFARDWVDYKSGFGDLNGEFWYGLENMHCLTTPEDVELRIDLKKSDGTKDMWTYQLFEVAGESDNYRLTIGQGEGTTSRDFMAYHNNRPFSTQDRDNEAWSSNSCVEASGTGGGNGGGWWFYSCAHAVLTRLPKAQLHEGANWVEYDDVEMKIRPKSCTH